MLKDTPEGITINKKLVLEGLEALYEEIRTAEPSHTYTTTNREMANLYGILMLMAKQLGWDEE